RQRNAGALSDARDRSQGCEQGRDAPGGMRRLLGNPRKHVQAVHHAVKGLGRRARTTEAQRHRDGTRRVSSLPDDAAETRGAYDEVFLVFLTNARRTEPRTRTRHVRTKRLIALASGEISPASAPPAITAHG